METLPTRFDSRHGCTEDKRGVTLVEMVVVLSAAIALGSGLVTALFFGIDAWERTVRRLEIQRTGNFILRELTRSIQEAGKIEIRESELIVHATEGETTKYRLHENRLYAVAVNAPDVNPQLISIESGDSVKVTPSHENRPFSWVTPGRMVRVSFDIAYRTDRIDEQYRFETVVYGRNSK